MRRLDRKLRRRNSTASACVRRDFANIRKNTRTRKAAGSVQCKIRARQNGLTTTRITIRIIRTVGTSLIILKNFCDLRRLSAAKSFT